MLQPSDIEFLANRYSAARNTYRPKHIRTIIIAESPPCDTDRYFYFEDVPKQDSLFLEVCGVLYPELKARYLKSRRDPALKRELLEQFQSDGFWLLDLSEVPHELTGLPVASALPGLMERLQRIGQAGVRIILIKANVFDCCYQPLVDAGFTVSMERIPFPSSGQQGVFRERFGKALAEH